MCLPSRTATCLASNCSGFLGAILAHPGGTYQILGLMKVCAPSDELALRLLGFFLVHFLGHNCQCSEVSSGSEFTTHSWQAWVGGTLWGAGDWSGSVVDHFMEKHPLHCAFALAQTCFGELFLETQRSDMEGTTLEGHPVDHQHVVSGIRTVGKHALQCPNLEMAELLGSGWIPVTERGERHRQRLTEIENFWIPIGVGGVRGGNMPTGGVCFACCGLPTPHRPAWFFGILAQSKEVK